MNQLYRDGRRRVPSKLIRRNNASSITLLLLLLCVLSPAMLYAGEERVGIQVLSKHFRQMREKGGGQVLCTFPPESRLQVEGAGSSIPVQRLQLSFHRGWHVTMDDVPVGLPVECEIEAPSGEEAFTLNLEDIKRTYPLPLYLSLDKNEEPVTVVYEDATRYASDSARAEYGNRPARHREALAALAHVILARCRYIQDNHPGHPYRFCDLTHCQVYRGRTGMPSLLHEDRWYIDHQNLAGPLLFHSRCGGHTMDMGVFGAGDRGFPPVKDILYRTGMVLCHAGDNGWTRMLSPAQVVDILDDEKLSRPPSSVEYDSGVGAVLVKGDSGVRTLAPETFRLKINRVMGWNFLKSNNYRLEMAERDDGPVLRFAGRGLGHNVGLCQHGALALAEMGYSRYEILEHYYRGITLNAMEGGRAGSPYLYFLTFDTRSGEVTGQSHPAMLERVVPPGSLWKIIMGLYLVAHRPDLVEGYHITCGGRGDDQSILSDGCWKPEGHGRMDLFTALSHSCNMYFASLAGEISFNDFNRFYSALCERLGLLYSFPAVKGNPEWSRRCAGLDFQVSMRMGDLVKVAMLVSNASSENEQVNRLKQEISPGGLAMLRRALAETFTMGTAAPPVHTAGPKCNWEIPVRLTSDMRELPVDEGLWGKTSTVIDGTNLPLGYGMFLGGKDESGILVILRKGNGHLAAQWGRLILADRLGECFFHR
ncbi:MAG: hypothetical protein ACOCWZ_07520 [Spirochaetota bacterium]